MQRSTSPGPSLPPLLDLYLTLGWHVLPLKPRSKDPDTRPHMAPHGADSAVNDRAQVLRWHTDAPDANWGVDCERSGLIGVDEDPRDGGDGSLRELEEKHGALADHPLAVTGRGDGGRHHYFLRPAGVAARAPYIAAGLQAKGAGYLVLPESIHPDSGKPYRWQGRPPGLDFRPVAPPAWLLSLYLSRPDTPKALLNIGIPTEPPDATQMSLLWSVDAQALGAWVGQPAPWLKDQSDSGRDMCVVIRAAQAGWQAEEIARLVALGRRKRGAKPFTKQYLERTIGRGMAMAKSGAPTQQGYEELGLDPLEKPTRAELLQAINATLGFDPPVTRILVTTGEPPEWRFEWAGKSFPIGDAGVLLQPMAFGAKLGNLMRKVAPAKPMKALAWKALVQMIFDASEVVETGEEGTQLGQFATALTGYLDEHPFVQEEHWEEACLVYAPYRRDGVGYISLNGRGGFVRYAANTGGMKLRPQDYAKYMKLLGWAPDRVDMKNQSVRTCRHIWGTKVKDPGGNRRDASDASSTLNVSDA